MKSIDFNKNDFPLTTNVLGFMQEAIALIEKITALVGGNYILSGCETVGGSVQSGYVVVNGEIMPFAGGTIQTYVKVQTTETEITVNDATYVKTEKQLVWGVGAGQVLWSTFRTGTDLLTLIESKADWGVYIPNVSGDVFDNITGNFPGGTVLMEWHNVIPSTAKFGIMHIEYYWNYQGDYQDFKIRATESEDDSNNIVLRAVAGSDNRKFDVIVVPVINGSFYIESTLGSGYLKFKLTLIGYF